MKPINSQTIDEIIEVVKTAGYFIKQELGKVQDKDIEAKALNSLVSYVDKEAEEMLVKALSEIIPGSGFITEEDTEDDSQKEAVWIIDPLDGTTNFLRQIPHFSVSVALQVNKELVFGAVYDVMRDEMYSAGLGKGAFLNGKEIKVSNTSTFKEAIIATGFPYEKKNTRELLEILFKIVSTARGVRRMGSAALDLVYVASGKFDVYYESNLNPWDVSAGILIVKEAGGQIGDFRGGNQFYTGKEIVASTPACFESIIEILEH